uniref:DUF148 domain-containing protein n=1 Tax=Panagrellus redivivus TaxID=6233 RepID=A0A7E4VJM9_PANRE
MFVTPRSPVKAQHTAQLASAQEEIATITTSQDSVVAQVEAFNAQLDSITIDAQMEQRFASSTATGTVFLHVRVPVDVFTEANHGTATGDDINT